ncbi:MAG: hypothetical protein CMJ64_26030 [Planctomycetaceae bacterium]|nr:hypothetical protein [Planctomycetaceae bacterium]
MFDIRVIVVVLFSVIAADTRAVERPSSDYWARVQQMTALLDDWWRIGDDTAVTKPKATNE